MLLLDEPLAALDPKLRKQMRVELKALQRRVGITFLLVTHDQEEALSMSDQIAVMNGGLVEQVGAPEDVYLRPQTTFVAGFLGAVNWIGGIGIRPESTPPLAARRDRRRRPASSPAPSSSAIASRSSCASTAARTSSSQTPRECRPVPARRGRPRPAGTPPTR